VKTKKKRKKEKKRKGTNAFLHQSFAFDVYNEGHFGEVI
jgi:hypothetical protein